MTIIDFATAASKSPRAFPNPLIKEAARLVLADALITDEPVLDPHRLMLAASQLPPHAMFLVDLVADPADARLSRFELALALPGGGDAAAVKRAACLLAPMARFGSAPSPDETGLVWSSLAPAPLVLDAGVDADGVPRSIWLSPSDQAAASFSCAIRCAEAAGVARLRIVVRARVLREDERAAVSHHVFSHHGVDNPAALERQMVLSHWCESQRGAVIEVEAGARSPLDDGALDYIAMALFGRARQNGPLRAHGLVVDLRCAAPPGARPAFRFLPKPSELRRRWQADETALPDGSGAVTLGLDASGEPVRLASQDRTMHTFIVGATGAGKTTLLRNMLRSDLHSGEGVVLIDPHGDLCSWTRDEAVRAGRADAVWVDPADPDCPIRLDLMNTPGVNPEAERNYVVNQLISLLSKDMYAGMPDAFGPMFEKYFRNACYLLMQAKEPAERNLLLIQKLFADEDFRDRLVDECPDEIVREFFSMAGRVRGEHHSLQEMAPYVVSKLGAFSDNPTMRRFFDPSSGTRLSLRTTMDEGGIVLVQLPKGTLGERDTHLLGGLLLLQMQTALLGRASIKEHERRHVRIYVDEFQNIANRGASQMLAEIRKYKGSLTLANQSLGQLAGGPNAANVALSVLGSCGTFVVLRVGVHDATLLAPYLAPHVSMEELLQQARGDFIVRRLADGSPQPAQHLRGEPPPTP